jgi:hypothetical protein
MKKCKLQVSFLFKWPRRQKIKHQNKLIRIQNLKYVKWMLNHKLRRYNDLREYLRDGWSEAVQIKRYRIILKEKKSTKQDRHGTHVAYFPLIKLQFICIIPFDYPFPDTKEVRRSNLRARLLVIRVSNQPDALFNVFISLLYMFRATQCSSSGESRRPPT